MEINIRDLSICIALTSAFFCAEVHSATVDCNFPICHIEGEIQSGDFDKFESLVTNYGLAIDGVSIASPGGNLIESMKIGQLVREMRFAVHIPDIVWPGSDVMKTYDMENPNKYRCVSSCFFIYVAGVERNGYAGLPSMRAGVLGIHRPFLSAEDYRAMNIDDAFAETRHLRDIVTSYLEEMGVPSDYADRMFSIPPNKVEWIDAEEIEKHFDGYIPVMKDWLTANCPTYTDAEQAEWDRIQNDSKSNSESEQQIIRKLLDKQSDIWDCQSREHSKVSCKAWERKYKDVARRVYDVPEKTSCDDNKTLRLTMTMIHHRIATGIVRHSSH